MIFAAPLGSAAEVGEFTTECTSQSDRGFRRVVQLYEEKFRSSLTEQVFLLFVLIFLVGNSMQRLQAPNPEVDFESALTLKHAAKDGRNIVQLFKQALQGTCHLGCVGDSLR